MICLRCGWCCKDLLAVVVDDLDKGIVEGNLIATKGDGSEYCKHLQGNKPGEYSCSAHSRPWYAETPCFEYQNHLNGICRMGEYILSLEKEKLNGING